MITIKEIAELAQVSTGTVDRVIHNRPGVSEKTAKRIRLLLEQHKFKLNDVASKLANRKKYTLATLLPAFDAENSFWKSPYLGVLKAKEEVGFYGVQTLSFAFNQFDASTYLAQFDLMMKSKPDAVVLVPTFKAETKIIVAALDKEEIPYLFLNTDIEGCNNVSYVGQDAYRSGKLVGKLLHVSLPISAEFLVVNYRENVDNYRAISNRMEGVASYFEEKNIAINVHNLTLNTLDNLKAIRDQLRGCLDENPSIKGLYIPSSQVSKVVAALSEDCLKELVVIGHDTTDENLHFLKKDLITYLISQKSFEQGYNAIQCMSDYLLQNKQPEQRILSPLEIVTAENY